MGIERDNLRHLPLAYLASPFTNWLKIGLFMILGKKKNPHFPQSHAKNEGFELVEVTRFELVIQPP